MSQKKETDKKPDVKVEDLAPKKDAKGGATRNPNSANPNAANQDGFGSNAAGANRVETSGRGLD